MKRALVVIAGLMALALMVSLHSSPATAQEAGQQGSVTAPAAQPATGDAGAAANPGMMGGPGMMRGQRMTPPSGPCPCMGGGGMGYMRGPGMMGHGMGMGMMGGMDMFADPKTRGEMMEIRGRMLKEMGDLMERRGKELAGEKK